MAKRLTALLALLLFACLTIAAQDVDTYNYDQLTPMEQMAYLAIQDCMTHLLPSWNSGSFSQETIDKAYNCFLMDHPEVYWSDGFTYVTSYVNNAVSGHHVEFSYTMERSLIQSRNKEIEQALIDIVLQLPQTEDQYQMVRSVYEWFISNCTYDELNLDQSMYSAMVNHSGVCASFSEAFQFIMQCLGIPCTVVHGNLSQASGLLGSTLGHEWNIVMVNGNWYHVDITSGMSLTQTTGELDHTYLCCTTEEILATHSISNIVPIPNCSSWDLNFFSYYGIVVKEYSREAVTKAFSNAMQQGLRPVAKFASYKTFCEAVDDLINGQGLFEVIPMLTDQTVQRISYYSDAQSLLFRFDI